MILEELKTELSFLPAELASKEVVADLADGSIVSILSVSKKDDGKIHIVLDSKTSQDKTGG